jgi:hypothetical protein
MLWGGGAGNAQFAVLMSIKYESAQRPAAERG